jgi:AcrR family transcriptional regulator
VTERDVRDRIRSAAERLIAERGPDVPLHDIALAAAQRNNSAVQYHFGSRDELIAAIVEHRRAATAARQLEMLAERETGTVVDEVRSLVEVLVQPLLEIPYQQGATHYARFLEQVRNHPSVAGGPRPGSSQPPVVRIVLARLDNALADLPPALRRLRLTSLASAMFALVADRERVLEAGPAHGVDPELSAANVVDVLVAMLTAAPSRAAIEAASRATRTRTLNA